MKINNIKKDKYIKSETIEINRSNILFAPYNPRKKKEEIIKKLIKNFKEVGFLGGIVWNKTTGNLISGHQRITALDYIHKYDGTNDYLLKVEQVNLDLKTEKEQNIFMNSPDAQSEFDNILLGDLMGDIDFDNAGLNQETVEIIFAESPNFQFGDNYEIKKEFKEITDSGKNIKEVRKEMKDNINKQWDDRPYIIITFDNIENKAYFCDEKKLDAINKYFRAETIFKEIFE
ncbi:MAG: ParB N-terminal domain-containing protein [Mariniphaga sp.]|nr:ParB N-terminal domain-containing protein [Paludibacter sp.]MDD4226005.1 ParB N-terminal domain-containing protein [Mariniphaga sp.]